MALRLYNTLTRRKEDFVPVKEGEVGIYACGVTVYDTCHIGHARSAINFDVITRYLRYRGYRVNYVKNFTDVDDKIIARANREGVEFRKISERYIAEHDRDMGQLGVEPPDVTPRATEHIPGMIGLIDRLIGNGLAYAVPGGDVYFSVKNFRGYGKLSGRNLDEMMSGARIAPGEKKKDPLDFALWKASKEGEPWWDSPWGKGRPGWHIECSVMSTHFLGETFDIHGGGEDLIFPHHENEIAQSEGASGKPFAKYWLHNGFIKVNHEKMSKSLGNFITIRDILKIHHPEVVRFFVLQGHYRSPLDFSEEALNEARFAMNRLYEALKKIRDLVPAGTAPAVGEAPLPEKERELLARVRDLPERFREAMDDDFNTARALGYLFEVVRQVNALVTGGPEASPPALFVLGEAERVLRETGGVLGILTEDPNVYFEKDRIREAQKRGLQIDEIEALIGERLRARKEKDWKRADEIRDGLAAKGVVLKDSRTGTVWTVEKPVQG
ncbi:MAG TPA: cysteine--tRNA ligase [Syntrophales bacterium]|nr:cysteine--tRNA ligase [Syntrophales bacterium]HQG83046.1 cysteine--tRNA ligase [Syntrophales bacterium]